MSKLKIFFVVVFIAGFLAFELSTEPYFQGRDLWEFSRSDLEDIGHIPQEIEDFYAGGPAAEAQSAANSLSYPELKTAAKHKRSLFAARYLQTNTSEEGQAIILEATQYLETALIRDFIPSWYGTPWDFNGISEIPGSGEIACGYFVSTILRDAGLRVERYKLAQQASAQIASTLAPQHRTNVFRDRSVEEFISEVREEGPGLYVIGLDYHVGFLYLGADEASFLHSSYYEPAVVVKEDALESVALQSSEVYVSGKILPNDELVRKWLLAEKVSTDLR